ncbi:MAG: hypothetical protein EBT37_12220 [Betaproteobacteria bacterium]|nr:hypothetical protein [Betaproteobacteria bacterium]
MPGLSDGFARMLRYPERAGATKLAQAQALLDTVRADAPSGLQETCQNLLRARLGVELVVVLAQPGEIKDLTGIESRQKPLRLIDRR